MAWGLSGQQEAPSSPRLPEQVAVSGQVGVTLSNPPGLPQSVEVKVANETEWNPWFWSEAGAAWVSFIAAIAALGVSVLSYGLVKQQNQIITRQGSDQITLIQKQNDLQAEMAAWQKAEGEQQAMLNDKQFALQEAIADWQKYGAEVELFDKCVERFLSAVQFHEATYSQAVNAELTRWKEGGKYSSFEGAVDAIREKYKVEKALAHKGIFHALETTCFYIHRRLLRDQDSLVILDEPVKFWYTTMIADHAESVFGNDNYYPHLRRYAEHLMQKKAGPAA